MTLRTWEIPYINLSKTRTLVFIDFETSGFNPWTGARIIEYSAIKVSPDSNEIYQKLAFPSELPNKGRIWISKKIQELTEITNKDVENEPDTFELFKEFYEFVDGNICVAHNAKFEKSFMDWYCQILNLEVNYIFRDTMPMFKKHYGVGSLSKISNSENAHMAFDDCYQMIRLMKECKEVNPSLLQLMEVIELPESTKKNINESVKGILSLT